MLLCLHFNQCRASRARLPPPFEELGSTRQYRLWDPPVLATKSSFHTSPGEFLLNFFACRHSHSDLNPNIFHSKPAILTPRIVLTEDELSVGLEPAVVHQVAEVDMNANIVSVAKHPGLHSHLISEVERNIGPTCQLAYFATDGEKSHIDQLDSASMEGIHDAGLSMERFFDKTDAELEISINSLLAQIQDLQHQVINARQWTGGGLSLAEVSLWLPLAPTSAPPT